MNYFGFPSLALIEQRQYRATIMRVGYTGMQTRHDELMRAACKAMNVDRKTILVASKRPYTFIRAFICRDLSHNHAVGLSELGRLMNRDHTTIMHYLKKVYPSAAFIPDYKELEMKIRSYL